MTRSELDKHLETLKFKEAAGATNAVRQEEAEILSQLTPEDMDRGEKAAKEHWEMGK